MGLLQLILGIVLLMWFVLEALWTTLWVDGNSAPLTSRVTTYIWRFFRIIFKSSNHSRLSLAGPIILFVTILMWILGILYGWIFIFNSSESSITMKDGLPTDFSDVMWYVSYVMFTVGNGDGTPGGDIWQIVSAVVSLSGMLMVTLSVTYILQVLTAVVNKRSFANQVISIGSTPEEFVSKQWNESDFGAMELQMVSLNSKLADLTEQHLAYPILNYYHAAQYENSVAVATSIYDEALTIISDGIPKKHHPAKTVLISGRSTVDSYLQMLNKAFIKKADESPPYPDFSKLVSVPTKGKEKFVKKLKKLDDRRKLLMGAIENDAWYWPNKD